MTEELYNQLKGIYDNLLQEKAGIIEKIYYEESKVKTDECDGSYSNININENEYHLYKERLKILNHRIRIIEFIIEKGNFVTAPLQVLDIQEKERQRIARDIHDSSLQNLTHLVHKIELSSMYIDEDPIKAKLELAAINKNLRMVIQEIRNTIFNLRPMSIDDLGLKESLEQLINKMKEDFKIEIDSSIENIHCNNSLILINIFRIVEECLNNVMKHSAASKVFVEVKRKNEDCVIIVCDNGKGFLKETLSGKNGHFGLDILKERVEVLLGTITIDTKVGCGTRIKIVIPLSDYE